ncbi:hypothetical protein NP493_2290g00003 [Ridgeia piscesae]|uniref:Sushi domain-containing protein n=1 Tax=Ridgeia piscesae TaxID=27915 RepID=A0AAD9JJG7_RIDPI|nr:hypothetical protein NP493_2290g00003 [Ridgeia piscesae]
METAKYACDEGYKADVIEATLVCGKPASWLGEPLICNEIFCETPTVCANCYIKADSLNYRSTIFYKCHKGFALVSGDKYRTCLSNGSWNGTESTCAVVLQMAASFPPRVGRVGEGVFVGREVDWRGPRLCRELRRLGICDREVQTDKPKTPKEKRMTKLGYLPSDEKVDHVVTEVVASLLLALSAAVVIALDARLLYVHLKMMRRNVSHGVRRLLHRATVAPERESITPPNVVLFGRMRVGEKERERQIERP